MKEWHPIHLAEEAEVRALVGRPLTAIDSEEAIYVDEDGNVFQLLNKGKTKPIEVEHLPGTGKTELEVLLETSLKERKKHEQQGGSKRMQKNRNNGRKQQALQVDGSAPQSLSSKETASAQPSANTTNGSASEAPVQLNLRQKLAEVRRRIGYVQKRGHNERNNYSYVTAADIAGSVGDILAELGVVLIPRLEDISYESAAGRGEATRMARVVMAYTFADSPSCSRPGTTRKMNVLTLAPPRPVPIARSTPKRFANSRNESTTPGPISNGCSRITRSLRWAK